MCVIVRGDSVYFIGNDDCVGSVFMDVCVFSMENVFVSQLCVGDE